MDLALGVLLSGSGTNLQAIIDRIQEGTLDARIQVVISNYSEAYGLERARNHGIACEVVENKDFPDRKAHDSAVLDVLDHYGVDTVILAGYMCLLGRDFVQEYTQSILNIHPSLLPSFKGKDAQKQAAEFGSRISGATVHFVDEYLDNGPIIIQGALSVFQGDTEEELSQRILQIEHRIYPQAIHWLAKGRLRINRGGHVDLLSKSNNTQQVLDNAFLISPPLEKGF